MKLRLKEIRTVRGLTQKELCEHLNCSIGAYSKYENGDREPSLDLLCKMADYYEVSVDYLIGRDVTDVNALSDYDKALISATAKSASFIQKNLLDVIEFLNSKVDSYTQSE